METIESIVREMRERDDECGYGWLEHYADRIEAAATATVRTDYTETLHNLLDENARLRAALKPVLEVDFDHGNIDGETLFAQIRKCQDIYNESEVK